MNFSASEALIQISQPANLPRFFFFQLAQILPEEQVFCRAAPLGTPDFSLRLWVVWTTTNYFYSQLAAKLLDGSFELAPLITLNDLGRSMFQVYAS